MPKRNAKKKVDRCFCKHALADERKTGPNYISRGFTKEGKQELKHYKSIKKECAKAFGPRGY